MNSREKISALVKLKGYITGIINDDDHPIYNQVLDQNPWFIKQFIQTAFKGLTVFLEPDSLESWIKSYRIDINNPKKVALILPGNVPMVGFHDLLCVLMSGHDAIVKPSHKDNILIPHLINKLIEIEPQFQDKMIVVNSIDNIAAVIATGSDNTARYIEANYKDIPKLIRKNKTSIAIIQGDETEEDLKRLSDDIFLYFGMGCRNVSKLYLPDNYDTNRLMLNFHAKQWMGRHQKFLNNYLHQKSFNQVVNSPFIDGRYFLLKESDKIFSPIGMIYYSYYKNKKWLLQDLLIHQEKIQTVVTRMSDIKNSIPFGEAQFPQLWNYSDGIDTMQWLLNLG